jgi:hypothetical protein
VLRIGLIMNQQSQYDDRAYLQNYLDNPGFEQAMDRHMILVGAGATSVSFKDSNNIYEPEPSGFWNGVTASERTGAFSRPDVQHKQLGGGRDVYLLGGLSSAGAGRHHRRDRQQPLDRLCWRKHASGQLNY